LLLLKKIWNASKSFGFVPKYFGINRNVPLLVKENTGTHQNALVSF
jgi:hypothetical protein